MSYSSLSLESNDVEILGSARIMMPDVEFGEGDANEECERECERKVPDLRGWNAPVRGRNGVVIEGVLADEWMVPEGDCVVGLCLIMSPRAAQQVESWWTYGRRVSLTWIVWRPLAPFHGQRDSCASFQTPLVKNSLSIPGTTATDLATSNYSRWMGFPRIGVCGAEA